MKKKWCKISEWLEKLTGLDCLITRHEGYKKKYIFFLYSSSGGKLETSKIKAWLTSDMIMPM